MKSALTLIATIALLFAASGCKKETEPKANDKKAPVASELPATLELKTKPEGAISVVNAREQVKAGEKVVLVGDIGGRVPPFVGKRAAFVIADETKLVSCDKKCGGCKTPWDYCCYEADEIAKAVLLVQVVDDQGKVVKTSLQGFAGLKELSKVVIVGTYDKTATKENPIVNATGIYKVN